MSRYPRDSSGGTTAFYVALGHRLHKARRAKGLSLEQVAQVLGMCAASVYLYEQGRRRIFAQTVVTFAELLDVSPSHLLGVRE